MNSIRTNRRPATTTVRKIAGYICSSAVRYVDVKLPRVSIQKGAA